MRKDKTEGNGRLETQYGWNELVPPETKKTVMVACGGKENNALFYALKGKVKELYNAGDFNGIRRVHHATMDGAQIDRLI